MTDLIMGDFPFNKNIPEALKRNLKILETVSLIPVRHAETPLFLKLFRRRRCIFDKQVVDLLQGGKLPLNDLRNRKQ